MIRDFVTAGVLALLLATTAAMPARSQGKPEGKAPPAPGAVLDEAMRRMLGVFELLIESIPQYEAPEVLENGDIIIRRKRPDESPGDEDEPAGDLPDRAET